jgi:hypothetical protein
MAGSDLYAVATITTAAPPSSNGVLVNAAVTAHLLDMQQRARRKRNCWIAGSVVGSVLCCLLVFPLLTSVYLVVGRDGDALGYHDAFYDSRVYDPREQQPPWYQNRGLGMR